MSQNGTKIIELCLYNDAHFNQTVILELVFYQNTPSPLLLNP